MTDGAPLRLVVLPAEGDPFERQISCGTHVIGRSSKADLMIPDRLMSREHARLFFESGAWFVEDLGSHNGTFANGARVQGPTRLEVGDTLGMGGSTVKLHGTSVGLPPPSHAPTREGTLSGGTIFRPATEVLRRGAEDHGEGREVDREALRASLERLRVLNQVHQALARPISLAERSRPSSTSRSGSTSLHSTSSRCWTRNRKKCSTSRCTESGWRLISSTSNS